LVSKGLDDEVVNARNTKREIKALIIQLQHNMKGLIMWGRRKTAKVSPTSKSRGIQVKLKPKTEDAQTSPHEDYPETAMPSPVDKVPSPDRSRFEIPASIEGLRSMMAIQGEAIEKFTNIVKRLQLQQPQQQQTKTCPS